MENFTKVVRLGTIVKDYGRPKRVNVFCEINWHNNRLSITGVEGPKANGDAVGSCGQIVMSLKASDIEPAPGWDSGDVAKFLQYWDEHHLNDLTAGSPAQEAHLKPLKDSFSRLDWFSEAKAALEAAGLQPDPGYLHNGKPYSYGSAWLMTEVPEPVLKWLYARPDTDITPAWV